MNERQPEDPQAPPNRRGAVAGLILIIALVIGGILLVHVLRSMSQIQDCVLAGHSNCAPIDSTGSDLHPDSSAGDAADVGGASAVPASDSVAADSTVDAATGSAADSADSAPAGSGPQDAAWRNTDRDRPRHPRD